MKQTVIDYIPGLEQMSDDALLNALSAVGEHPVDCVNWESYPYAPQTTIRLAFSEKALAVMFRVKEEHARGLEMDDKGNVWEDSCVEVFIADPCGEGYYNFEVNCIGTRLAARRLSKTDFKLFDEEKMSRFRTFGSLPHKQTDIAGKETEWHMIEVIPFELLGLDEAPESLRANFYKCGDMCRQPHFLSWSPIDLPQPEFHCPQFFGKLIMTQTTSI